MGKIAFVFAGQGAQTVGMGKDLYDRYQSARTIYDMAGERVRSLSFHGPAQELAVTINTQPCLFAMDLSCARALNEHGVYADGVAGFSLGEIPAVAYCGMMCDSDAYAFVCMRARAMQRCAEQKSGAMFAVLKLSTDETARICAALDQAYPVNYNYDRQTVVACAEETSDALQKAVLENGGRLVKLSVSGAFHSPFMDAASEEIAAYLQRQTFQEMRIPLYSNVTGMVYDKPRELLAMQVKSPVQWQKTIETMIADGFDTFIEVGAGKTLSGLIGKINESVRILHSSDIASIEQTVAEVKHA